MGKRIIASIFVIISGLILISDKLHTFHFSNNFGYHDSLTLVWTFSQTISPIILIIAFCLNPYKIFFTVPIYIYAVQIYFIFSSQTNDKNLVHLYATGSVALFLICVFTLNAIFKDEKNKDAKISALEALLDLHIAIYAKK